MTGLYFGFDLNGRVTLSVPAAGILQESFCECVGPLTGKVFGGVEKSVVEILFFFIGKECKLSYTCSVNTDITVNTHCTFAGHI